MKGQEHAKRALEVAAAGGHNILLLGPPGSGKTLLARALPSILPAMMSDESLDLTRIYSVAGLLPSDTPLVAQRPFRSPHYTTSHAGLVGGGHWPRPGEVTLAHHGVLFLDELPEFGQSVLEVLRQPMEDKVVTISRAQGSVTFPANFMLVGAMNPCACGWYGDPRRECTCEPRTIARYRRRISGPLLDRIDLFVEVPRVEYEKLTAQEAGETSTQVRERVEAARGAQRQRFPNTGFHSNSDLGPVEVWEYCQPEGAARELARTAMEQPPALRAGLPSHTQGGAHHRRPGGQPHHRRTPPGRGDPVPAAWAWPRAIVITTKRGAAMNGVRARAWGALILAMIAVLAASMACGGEEEDAPPAVSSATPTAATAPAQQPQTPAMQWDAPPAMSIDTTKQYHATLRTSYGDITLELYPREVPVTVNNFVFLARQGYYDGVAFHRIVRGFMVQGGDPTGTGRGGPGYRFADEQVTPRLRARHARHGQLGAQQQRQPVLHHAPGLRSATGLHHLRDGDGGPRRARRHRQLAGGDPARRRTVPPPRAHCHPVDRDQRNGADDVCGAVRCTARGLVRDSVRGFGHTTATGGEYAVGQPHQPWPSTPRSSTARRCAPPTATSPWRSTRARPPLPSTTSCSWPARGSTTASASTASSGASWCRAATQRGRAAAGPGYRFADEPVTRDYLRGTLAMANAGPNTNGSQFFIVHQDAGLPPAYTIFGMVTEGLDTLDAIANVPVGMGPSGERSAPEEEVVIQSIENHRGLGPWAPLQATAQPWASMRWWASSSGPRTSTRWSRFYATVLELPPAIAPTTDFAAFTLQSGVRLSIGLHDGVRGASRDPHRVMVNLGVADIHRAAATLRERGVAFTREPEQEHWGGWVATFHDPDGNTLQLLQGAF